MSIKATVGGINLSSPILLASGTCNFGRELAEYIDFGDVGGICSKGLTLSPRAGNDGCRVAETPSGMLNSVGLQNPGVDYFIENDLDFMASLGTRVIVNVAGHSTDDYIRMASRLNEHAEKIDVLELNLSCPNVKEGCMIIGSSPKDIRELVRNVRSVTALPLWVKLTPNVTSIADTALAAQEGGADAVVAINTLLGMAIDIRTRRPILRNNTGGLSGPAIKPVALRMVSECHRVLDIPVVGCGGAMDHKDVLEFMIAGASAVEIGTALLIHPTIPIRIAEDLRAYTETNNISELSDIVGTLELWG
ncbi:MAG: dihydroorotate dehydrogenase [Oscillospiraceae bacterium]|nr:dihydroorotate dehydrogenase [Oscillospiraceae bacterium]